MGECVDSLVATCFFFGPRNAWGKSERTNPFLDGQKLGHRRLDDPPHTQQNIVIIFNHQFKPCNHIEPGTIVLKNVGGGWHSSPQFQRLSVTKKLVFPWCSWTLTGVLSACENCACNVDLQRCTSVPTLHKIISRFVKCYLTCEFVFSTSVLWANFYNMSTSPLVIVMWIRV